MDKPEDISRRFERRHLQQLKAQERRLLKAYEKAIDDIYSKAGAISLKKEIFDITKQPKIKKLVDNVLLDLHEEITTVMMNGIDAEWDLAESKTDAIISNHLSKKQINETAKAALFTRRESALKAFKERKIKGLNLSQKVWNYTNQFRGEIERGLFAGISEGKSAVKMAQDQKMYLRHPNMLFRRVKDAKGNLKLSNPAQQFKPGKGVYRSSYKNALRLTRTETNMAYRTADNERYSRSKFILGYEVKLSANHPMYDICDHLKGKYPSDFKFKGWHPNCMCFSVPLLPSAAEYDKYEEALLTGKGDEFEFRKPMKNVPGNFTKYVNNNRAMLKRLKSTPYWVRDNKVGI